MNNTITLTDEQMKALQSGQSITIEPPKPTITKWEPKGGDYRVQSDLTIFKNQSSRDFKNSGIEYKTQAQAEQAAKALRSYARQLAWVSEHYDGWEADWSDRDQNKYYVFYCNNNRKFKPDYCFRSQDLATIYMSKANAIKLTQLMNDGIVEF